MLKYSRYLVLIPALTCLSLFPSCGAKNNDPGPRTAQPSGIMVVKGIVLRKQALDNVIRSSGTVLASESVDLVAEASGRIENIAFKEGTHVRKNEVLLRINDDDLQARDGVAATWIGC